MGKGKTKSAVRKRVAFPRVVIFCLLILVLIMGAWIFVRGALVSGLISSITNLENQNYQVSHDGLSVDGFPFSVNAEMRNVTVRAPMSETPDPTQNWFVTSDSLRMYSATVTPLSWNIEHRGQMRIDMHGRNGERFTFDVTPATMDGRATYSLGGVLKSAHIKIAQAQLDSLVGTPPIISQFDQIVAHVNVSQNTGHILMSGSDFRLSPKIPNMLDTIMGRKLVLVELDANVDNWSLLETKGTEPWIAANSRIQSDHWAVQWGRADIIGNFDIIFKNGLPEGSVQIRLKKPKALLQQLIDNGLIDEQYTSLAKTLVALQKTEPDGRKSIDITIKDGVVKAGFIPIYKF